MLFASNRKVSHADLKLATYAPVFASPNTYASGPKNDRRQLTFYTFERAVDVAKD
jgi:hypothetical protein